jgi:hypothetical protein
MTPTPEIVRIITTKAELVDTGYMPFTSEIYTLHLLLFGSFALFAIALLIRFWINEKTSIAATDSNKSDGMQDV